MSYFGCKMTVKIDRLDICTAANWTGKEPQHHSSEVLCCHICCYSSRTLSWTAKIHYLIRSICVEMDSKPCRGSRRTHTIAPRTYGIWFWSHLTSRFQKPGCWRVLGSIHRWTKQYRYRWWGSCAGSSKTCLYKEYADSLQMSGLWLHINPFRTTTNNDTQNCRRQTSDNIRVYRRTEQIPLLKPEQIAR